MSLTIVKSTEPLTINNIIMLIYGDPGVWKTSLSFTAKRPILFDFDKGGHRAPNRKDLVPVNEWYEVANLSPQDLKDYDTIIIDTAGRALDVITESLKNNPSNTRKDGQLSQQGYGKLGGIFTDWLKTLRCMGKDIVLLAHTAEDKDGDDIIKRPDMIGGSKREAYKIADMMGYMTKQNNRGGTVRVLNFVSEPSFLAKDSGGMGNIIINSVVDNPNQLANIIQSTKDHINSFSEAQTKAYQDLDRLREKIMGAVNADDFNQMLAGLDKTHMLDKQMRQELWAAAKVVALVGFDETKKCFVDIKQKVEDTTKSEVVVDNTGGLDHDSQSEQEQA